MAHQHRGAYDAIGQPWSDLGLDDASLDTHRQLTDWDARVLAEHCRRFTISGVVTDRLATYCGLDSTPLYHPPPLADRIRPGESGDYVLGVSRLEGNKRPDLVVDAVLGAQADVRGLLAGTGSLAGHLAGRARGEAAGRVELAGFVDDEDLIDLLAGCLAVVYAPANEDYGYVTLQAFLAGKPVVTCGDAGGVLEWVDHGRTGLVADPTPEGLGAAVDRLAADPAEAARMGAAGRAMVERLSWPAVVDALVGAGGEGP